MRETLQVSIVPTDDGSLLFNSAQESQKILAVNPCRHVDAILPNENFWR
jgi:hypothetical protein